MSDVWQNVGAALVVLALVVGAFALVVAMGPVAQLPDCSSLTWDQLVAHTACR